jgi:hypothetical protein
MSHLVRVRASMSAQLAFSLQWRKILELDARDPLQEFLSSDEVEVSDLHLFHLEVCAACGAESQSDLAAASLGRARIFSLGTSAQTADLAMSTNVNIFRWLHVCLEMSARECTF